MPAAARSNAPSHAPGADLGDADVAAGEVGADDLAGEREEVLRAAVLLVGEDGDLRVAPSGGRVVTTSKSVLTGGRLAQRTALVQKRW